LTSQFAKELDKFLLIEGTPSFLREGRMSTSKQKRAGAFPDYKLRNMTQRRFGVRAFISAEVHYAGTVICLGTDRVRTFIKKDNAAGFLGNVSSSDAVFHVNNL
jgi:hypothetical protein